jgi:hypothetical protein
VTNPAALALARTLTEAVAAAQAGDSERFDDAAEKLIAQDKSGAGRVGLAQAAVISAVLETRHPDGLTGEDARDVLEHTARATIGWLPTLDVNVLLAVLAGALGVLDPDAEPYPASPLDLSRHASVLIAALLGPTDSVSPYVAAAIAEIHRAQTIEMP